MTHVDGEAEHATKHEKRVNKLFFFFLAIIGVGIGLTLFWSFASEDVIEVKNTPVPIRTVREFPEADGVVILKVNFCKKAETVGEGRISFVSQSREIFLPRFEERGHKGCEDTEFPVLIPKDIPAGEYYLRFRITYDINPLKQDVVEEFQSKEFQVVPHGEQNKAIN